MEHENPNSGKRIQCLDSDIISILPENITEKILTLMPIRDALRTSILSKKWRYSWRSMPKLNFSEYIVENSNCDCGQLKKYKVVSAIFHVLLLHNGPSILHFTSWVRELDMDSEFSQLISYLARGNKLKELTFLSGNPLYKLPVSFFSMHGLEVIHLANCTFEPPLAFDGFSRLKSMTLSYVNVHAQMLQRFLSKCPFLELIRLDRFGEGVDFEAGGNKFTFVDLVQCVPLIRSLDISTCYMKYLFSGGIPHKLPTSLAHLKHLFLGLHMAEQDEISSALCIFRSSPLLENINFMMFGYGELCVEQNPTNLFDPKDYSDLMLNNLEILEIHVLCKLPLVMDFVKLVMAKSPVLKKVRIKLFSITSVDEELKMLRDLVLLTFPRASPLAKLIIERV